MLRDSMKHLIEWRVNPIRKPLIIRGARQVGKSWLIAEFGRSFQNLVEINFEKERKAKQWFAGDLDVNAILKVIALQKETQIIPGKTLLFLDEIQECEDAIKLLRYFKEELPELHVIAAGSLLDFAIEQIGLPVGRVQFMYLYPISFSEFLSILSRNDLREYIQQFPTEITTHQLLLELLKTYCWLGGMPAVIKEWIERQDMALCQRIQDEIIETYQQDFYKYANSREIQYVTDVFNKIPNQLGNKFKYTQVDTEVRSIYFKNALSLLQKAGIAHLCYHTGAQQQPLKASIDIRKFKVFFFDIGITQRLLGLDIKQWMLQPLKLNNIGKIAEQLVAQELIAYAPCHQKASLYYWHREAKSSNAEVDFITLKNGVIVPIEVKSATTGRLRSLHLYLQSHLTSPLGLKISEGIFNQNGNITEIPFYAIEAWLNHSHPFSF